MSKCLLFSAETHHRVAVRVLHGRGTERWQHSPDHVRLHTTMHGYVWLYSSNLIVDLSN